MNAIQLLLTITAGIYITTLGFVLFAIIEAVLNYKKHSKKNFPLLTNLDKWEIATFALYALLGIIGLLYTLAQLYA